MSAPQDSDILLQILLIAGNSSTREVEYVSKNSIWNVKKSTTWGTSAVVKNYSSGINFEATQRLNAEDLRFAYLVGLIEGDGWFSVTKNGEYIKYEFGIELDIRDVQLLYKIKKILGVGTINIRERNNQKMVFYRIRNKSHLKSIVLPIFDKYPMFSNKQYDYLMFKELLLNDVKYSKDLNKYIRPIQPINTIETILEKSYFKYWLIGFIEAEGCFSIYTPSKDNSKVASFDISQTNGSILIEAIKIELSLTPKVYKDKNNNFKLKVSSVRAVENIVKYMHNSPLKLMGHKKLQYLLWLKELRTISRYTNKFNIPNKY
uniref:LAGLIDADG endonuclease n=1 Tax=Mucor indicus TaxID=64623 RepID=UPI002A7F9711|nr:LAGLIDADG endonuclease [Mucor indicus]WPA89403.1 LAGLIDADG endonuclease [Mucor indicus]